METSVKRKSLENMFVNLTNVDNGINVTHNLIDRTKSLFLVSQYGRDDRRVSEFMEIANLYDEGIISNPYELSVQVKHYLSKYSFDVN